MPNIFPVSASSYSDQIDNLILTITWVVGVAFVLAELAIFWALFKYRRRPGVKAAYITGEKKEEKKWINIPHFIIIFFDVFLIFGAIKVWVHIKQHLPEADQQVRIIGQQWMWSFEHAGADGEFDTADDVRVVNELHLLKDTVYHYHLSSRDVLHCFSVPAFRLKQDSVPGREIKGWFKPTLAGEYDLQCAEMCGIGHGLMMAKVIVHEDSASYEKYMADHAPATPSTRSQVAAVNN
jgi:cytochrome c oxidase subunit 2